MSGDYVKEDMVLEVQSSDAYGRAAMPNFGMALARSTAARRTTVSDDVGFVSTITVI